MLRTVPPTEIHIGGARVRASRRLASQIAAAGLSAVTSLRTDQSRPDEPFAAVEEAHEILATVRDAIRQTLARAAEMRAVDALLKTGEYADTNTPALRAAESARGYAEAIRAAQADVALDSLDDAAASALKLARAFEVDCTTATGRAERIDQRCRTLAAHALARATERQAVELLRRFPLPPELSEVVDGLEPKAAIEAARQFQHSKAATLSARKQKRRAAERQLVVDELIEVWS